MANHTAYTPEIAHAVLSALRVGCSERDACAGAGLSWSTWCSWKRSVRKDEGLDERIVELVRAVPQAAAQGRNAIAAKINKLAGKDYRAGAWLLEWHEKRAERKARLALLRAEIELAALKIAAGGVEKHEHAVIGLADGAALAREVFGSPSALERRDERSGSASAGTVEGDVLPVPDPLDH
jgi:hypothetical protein